jgi:hypothetical protein
MVEQKEHNEAVCKVCGTVATSVGEMCDHLKKKHEQGELPGMPDKNEETIVAEDILDMRDHLKKEKDKLDEMKVKLVGLMRLHQKSHMLVKGWDFDVELHDKLEVKKHKK